MSDTAVPPDAEAAYAALRAALQPMLCAGGPAGSAAASASAASSTAAASSAASSTAALPSPRRTPHLIGIHSGGAWVARRLHRELGLTTPLGLLSSAFHRDDYGKRVGRGLPADLKASELPLEIDGAHLVLVDDILFTGRTVRAALNELFDYGRPARVELAVLIDRGGRELPIEAGYCGVVAPLAPPRNYVLTRDEADRFTLRIE